jgi:hypothetical protein
MLQNYILENGKIRMADITEWAMWFENVDNRRIERTTSDDFDVSTVFLGIDHNFSEEGPAILFETCILEGPEQIQGNIYRYATMGEAKTGHRAIVDALKLHAAEKELGHLMEVNDFDHLGVPSIMNLISEILESLREADDQEVPEEND